MRHHGEKLRCKAKRIIRGHQGLISADDCGTIEAEIDNLGRRMISVAWDNGLHMYVFPDEIKLDDEPADACHAPMSDPRLTDAAT